MAVKKKIKVCDTKMIAKIRRDAIMRLRLKIAEVFLRYERKISKHKQQRKKSKK